MLASTLAIATVAVSLVAAMGPAASAADADDFQPGFLIADALFFDGDSLSASQVDAFIAAKNPGCAPGRVCLENYRENLTAKAATSRCSAIAAKSNQTAGQIIAAVAKACGISPRVIIVILQKEQSLITSTAPSSRAFQASMGAGCPDTAPCDGRYAGFYENVYYGASLLKGYTIPGTSNYSRYPAGKTSKIQYNPKTSCGTKSVFVANQATHALYVYTPYTPNAAALSNLYGTGDSCSAYGNRNFWRLFTDWFGTTNSAGANAIEYEYLSNGGADGALGAATSIVTKESANGGGMYQRFEHGWITWTKSSGAQIVPDVFVDFYRDSGGPAGTYGWPTTKASTASAGGGGTRQDFQNGVLTYSNAAATVIPVTGGIVTAMDSYGGISSGLGWPLEARTKDATTGMVMQRFQGGIILHDGKQFWSVAAEFEDFYRSTGMFTGRYGKPTSKVYRTTASGGGVRQNFEGGVLMYSTAAGRTLTIAGGFISAMDYYGGVENGLGWPLTARMYNPATKLYVQKFQRGTILHTGSGHVAIANEFVDGYLASGGLTGTWGKPTSKPYYSTFGGGGVRQNFASGARFSSAANPNVLTINGGFLTAFNEFGGVTGGVGWPVTSRSWDASLGMYRQEFQSGTILHTGTKHALIASEFAPTYLGAGGPSGTYGWPAAAPLRTAKGVTQTFASQALFSSSVAPGIVTVSGGFLTAFAADGGVQVLGWPLGNRSVDAATGLYVQNFETGSLVGDGTHVGFIASELLSTYMAAGGGTGTYGWPTSMPKRSTTGVTQSFTGGTLVWTADGGVKVVARQVAAVWAAAGGLEGTYGWPTAGPYASSSSGGGVREDFTGGTLMYSTAAQAAIPVTGGFIAAMDSYGGVAKGLGWPLSPRTSKDAATGYYRQVFQNGTLVLTTSANTYVANAFAASMLDTTLCGNGIGWTLSLPTVASGVTTQPFEHATLSWTAAGGTVVQCAS